MSEEGLPAHEERRPLSGPFLPVLDRACRVLMSVAIAAVLIFTLGQVLDRHFIKGAIYFQAYDQLARMALIWLTFVGIAICFRDGANVRVDLFENLFPARLRIGRDILMDAAIIGISLYLNYKSWRLLEIGSYQAILGTPLTYVWAYVALLVGTVLISVFLVVRIVWNLRRLGNR